MRAQTMWLVILTALLGATAVMGQSLYVREILVAFFGNELSLGVVLGAWLFGVVLGARLGGRVARRTHRPILWLATAAVVGAVTLPAGLVVARALRLIAAAEGGSFLPFRWLLIGSALVTVPFSILIGFTFPVASRSARPRRGAPASGISLIYVAEALGAVGGGLTFSFLLISRVSAFHVATWMTALVVCVAVAPMLWTASRLRHVVALGPATAAIGLAIFAAGPLDDLTTRLRWRSMAPEQALVATAESRYGNIALGEWDGQYNLYLDGHFATSFPEPRAFSHAAHLVLCQHPDPKNVLVIGGGMEGLLAPMRKHRLAIDYVQLDPALIRLLLPHIGGGNRDALRDRITTTTFLADGRSFVRTLARPDLALERLVDLAVYPSVLGERDPRWELNRVEDSDYWRWRESVESGLQTTRHFGYDVVFLNVPEPSNASINRFYTAEFLREVERILAKDGVLVATLPTAGANYLGIDAANYTGSFYHTLRDVFDNVVVAPDPDTRWFFASDGDTLTSDPAVLAGRYEERRVEDGFFHPILFEGDFPEQRVKDLAARLAGLSAVPRNTDQRPVTYFYDTILWGRYSSSRIAGAFKLFERASFWTFMAAFGAVIAGWLMVRRFSGNGHRRGLSLAGVWAVGAFGFAAMALEIVLLFAYQNLFGTIYQRIAAAVALFMAGLTVGALASRWFLIRLGRRRPTAAAPARDVRRVAHAAALVAVLLAALALALPWYLRSLSGAEGLSEGWMEFRVLAVMVAAGVLTGAMFPLASSLHLAAQELRAEGRAGSAAQSQIGRTAGIVDAADHGGACLGALATGVVLVPILGVGQTAVIIAGLAITTLVLVLLAATGTRSA